MLSPDKERAIALLSVGGKPSVVAATLGVSDRTVRAWRAEPAFAAELEEAQKTIRSAGKVRLVGLLDEALDAVQDVLRDTDAAPAARLRAAELVLARVGLDELKAADSADPADVNRILAFMKWDAEQQSKTTAAATPQSEGNDDDSKESGRGA